MIETLPPDTPVIIGVGQYAERIGEPGYRTLSPMDLAGEALKQAIADCGADVAGKLDTVAAIRQFEISTPNATAPFGGSDNPPRSIARRAGCDPDRAILEVVGGQGPQKLVGELAAEIAEGRCGMAAIVGSEAISTALALMKSGDTADWSEEVGGEIEDRGFGMRGLLDKTLIAHGLVTPISLYALFENARRAARGASLDAYRHEMGELFAPFTEVAAANPYAAAPIAHSAGDLARVTERNRIVAEPFPRMMVARDQVNQAAAIILSSVEKAREAGIPEERWVYIHASADAKELSVLERPDLACSSASIAGVETALETAGIGIADIGYFDLYSCFPIAVSNIADAFGIAPDDPRGLTLTGGLPFFGGAGNNYSAHAIAEAVARLRDDPDGYALVGANGGFMSKYSTGIYSRRPASWEGRRRWRTVPECEDKATVIDSYSGSAVVESYTVIPSASGDRGAIVGRAETGERFVAVPNDESGLARLREGEPFGRRISVTAGEDRRNSFVFSD
jgi:acetyl-CoA C-acetyltransferase